MKTTQRNMAVLLTVIMAGGALAGCASKTETNTNTNTSAAPAATVAAKAEPPIEITWTGRNPPTSDDNAVQKYLEKKFNVKIKNINLDPTTWKDQLNVKLAAGEIPDVITNDAGMDQMQAWADQGVIASLSVDEIKKYMPKYTAEMEKLDPNAFSYSLYKGKNWGIPKVYLEGNSPFLPIYNSAWLKAVGVSKTPETIQELEDLLTKFRNNDPDGNGKKDTYGISARGKDAPAQMFSSIFASYGVNRRGWNLDKNGKVVYGSVTEEARQAFKTLAKWYKDGLIDPEFATDDWVRLRANFLNGRTGEVDTGLWYHDHDVIGAIGAEWKAKGQQLTFGKGYKGPDGKALLMAANTIPQPPKLLGAGVMKDEKKRIKIMQILEDISTNDESYLMTQYGEKGVNYDLNGETAVPKPEFADLVKRGAATGAFWFGGLGTPSMLKHDRLQDQLDFKAKVNGGIETTKDPVMPAVLPSASKVQGTLDKMVDEYMIKFIMGTTDTDKGFDQFVADWMKAGGQQMTDEANTVYNERKKK